MYSVERSSEPQFFDELRSKHSQWGNLSSSDRLRIRDALVRDFGTTCAYCERPCQQVTATHQEPVDESIDHFRPRIHFPQLWLDWLNLVYACRRCNQAKGGQWPGFGDTLVNQMLVAEDPRYMPPSEYVNPNYGTGKTAAGEFFAYEMATGEVLPSPQLGLMEWSIARRTISDIDLNDSALGENDESHLWNRRLEQQALLIQRIGGLDGFDAKVNIMLEFMQPDKPFSSFISAYVRERFPLFDELFGRR